MPKVGDEYREEVKARVILAALDVFSQHGYHKAKMEEIAEKAAVSKGTLYNQFAGKEDLFRGITEYLLKEEMMSCEALMTEENPVKAFKIMFEEVSRLYEGRAGFIFEIFSTMFRDEKMRTIITEAISQEVEGFTQIVAAIQEDNKIRGDVDPKEFSLLLMALFMGIFTLRTMFGSELVPEKELLDTGLNLVLRG